MVEHDGGYVLRVNWDEVRGRLGSILHVWLLLACVVLPIGHYALQRLVFTVRPYDWPPLCLLRSLIRGRFVFEYFDAYQIHLRFHPCEQRWRCFYWIDLPVMCSHLLRKLCKMIQQQSEQPKQTQPARVHSLNSTSLPGNSWRILA
jgi:hypothetical protein